MGFNQEIKDFINAFAAGQKIGGFYDDQAYKRKRLQLMDAQIGHYGALGGNIQSLSAYRKGLLERMNRENAVPDLNGIPTPSIIPPVEPATPPAARTGALGVGPSSAVMAGGDDGNGGDDEDEDNTTQLAATGGLITPKVKKVKHYKTGGLVTGGDDDVDDESADAETEGEGGGEDMEGGAGGTPYSMAAAHDAVREGTQYNQQRFGLTRAAAATPDPTRPQRVRAYMSGAGAASPDLMKAVYDKVDPSRAMSEAQRNMAAYSVIYQFYMRQGNLRAAQAAAADMLQQHRLNFMHYAAMAKAAANGGNMDGAALFAAKAYANIPNGTDIKVQKEGDHLIFTALDEKGQPIKRGILSPQQLGSMVTGLTPDMFDKGIVEMAGIRQQKAKPPTGDKPADVEKRQALIEDEFKGQEPGEQDDDVKSIAYGILSTNKKINSKDAKRMAEGLLDPTKKPKTSEAEGGAYYQFSGGPKVFLSDDTIERITEIQTRARHYSKDDPATVKQRGFLGGLNDTYQETAPPPLSDSDTPKRALSPAPAGTALTGGGQMSSTSNIPLAAPFPDDEEPTMPSQRSPRPVGTALTGG